MSAGETLWVISYIGGGLFATLGAIALLNGDIVGLAYIAAGAVPLGLDYTDDIGYLFRGETA